MTIEVDRSVLKSDRAEILATSNKDRVDFKPKRLLHAFYTYAPGLRMLFSKTLFTYTPDSNGNLDPDVFISGLRKGKIPYTETYDWREPSGPSARKLDIGVEDQCYVFIELDPTRDWTFSRKKKGITLKKSEYQHEHGDLFHVHPGTGIGQPDPMKDHCRLLYFSVLSRSDWKPRLFDCNVLFLDGTGSGEEISIDPDIPNTGSDPDFPD